MLVGHDLLKYIDGTYPSPPPTRNVEKRELTLNIIFDYDNVTALNYEGKDYFES